MKKITTVMALSAALFMAGCTANQIGAGINIAANLAQGYSISNEQLAVEAGRSAQAMDNKHSIAPAHNAYAKRLNRLTAGLQRFDGIAFNYKVYLSDKINAFAMPDGTVRVFSGLMDIMNDDELLAVIGHEIGHVKHQHALQQFRKAYVAKAAAMGLAAYGGSTVSALTGAYGQIGLQAVSAKFSRKDELEADEYGVVFLKRIGRNPYAAVSAQKKLQQKGGGGGGMFSSHPSSAERIERTTAAANRLKNQ